MADNTRIKTGDQTGDVIATDALATLNGAAVSDGEKVQRVKVGYGSDGDLRDVDEAHALPVADADVAGVATATTLAAGNITTVPAKLMGFTIRETAGATAVVRLRDSNATGTILATISLIASESVRDWFGPGGIDAPTKIYCEVVSGTVEGAVFSK